MYLAATPKEDQILIFKTDYRLMQVESNAHGSSGSILQYFRPSLSYHLSLRSFCLFLSGRSLKDEFTATKKPVLVRQAVI